MYYKITDVLFLFTGDLIGISHVINKDLYRKTPDLPRTPQHDFSERVGSQQSENEEKLRDI